MIHKPLCLALLCLSALLPLVSLADDDEEDSQRCGCSSLKTPSLQLAGTAPTCVARCSLLIQIEPEA